MKYPIKFKAAILKEVNAPLTVGEVTFHGPLSEGQVLVKVRYSGICGKQIEEIKGVDSSVQFIPHLLGHEGSGVVADVGPGVKKVCVGDVVVLHWLKGSGINSATPVYSCNEQRINAGWLTTFNEYGVISENRLTPIPKGSDLSVACLLGCAVSTGLSLIFNEIRLKPQDSIAVFGCGGVGLSVIQGAAIAGCSQVIAVDKNPRSLELAKKIGASTTIDALSEDPLVRINKITSDKGVTYVVVALGDPAVIQAAAQASSFPGYVYLVGVPPLGATSSFNVNDIHRGRTILGSCGGGAVPDRDIPHYISLYEKGALKLKELVSKTVTLSNINEGISLLASGNNAGRCVIEMDQK